jgi:hypothetical protein
MPASSEALSRPPAERDAWRCDNPRCRRFLGRVVAGVLYEPNGGVSALPCIRVCRGCKKRNTRIA